MCITRMLSLIASTMPRQLTRLRLFGVGSANTPNHTREWTEQLVTIAVANALFLSTRIGANTRLYENQTIFVATEKGELTMAEYIEREALIKAIENDCPELVYYTKEDAIQCVKAIPAADVAPVVHACWIGYETMSWRHGRPKQRKYNRCSNCRAASAVRHKTCPNCRAIMDADTQEREGGK